MSAFIEPGDAVVIPSPTYGLYAQACAVAGAEVHRVEATPTLALDLEGVAAVASRRRARLVWICDPNNPSGLPVSRSWPHEPPTPGEPAFSWPRTLLNPHAAWF